MVHPSELRCTLSELRCALRTTLLPLDKLGPSELCYSLLSYAASFWATLYTTELRLTLNELRGTLKNIMYPAGRSFADLNDVKRKPREMSQFGKKSAKVYHCLYSSIEQLQVAL
jgi:hypothetical protein